MATTPCSVEGCDNPQARRGWCQGHYARWRRHGDVNHGGPVKKYRPRGLDTEANVFAWVMPGQPPTDGCWDWSGVVNADGYGILTVNSGNVVASRASYKIHHGEIPEGLFVLHSCDRPVCVNPAHLRLGTKTENMADMVSRGRHAPGERHPNAKLTEADVVMIRTSDRTLAELAEMTGVSFQTVSRIRRGERWAHV